MLEPELDQIRVVRLELHEDLMKIPQYRALRALDEILQIIEKSVQMTESPKPEPAPTPLPEPEKIQKESKPLTQVQALLHILSKKETAASMGWLLAELELLGVPVGGISPRKTLSAAFHRNKHLFRRVEYEGSRWMWGLVNRRYPGETTYNHLPATEFKSMRLKG